MVRVLVAYGTKYGSTRGVAEEIARTLEARGVEVVVSRAREVRDLAGFSAVIVGAPLYLHGWQAEASDFVRRFRIPLCQKRVALFAVGLSMLGHAPENLDAARAYFESSLRELPEVAPVSTALFTGALRRRDHPLPMRLYLWWHRAPEGDFRDWPAVRRWAERLDFHHLPAPAPERQLEPNHPE